MNGSGNVAIDAAIGSCVRTGDKILVGVNGFFGQRMATIARCYGAQVVELHAEAGKAITGASVESALRKESGIRAISLVHLETSTGVLNPVAEIGKIAERQGIPLIVDAVSSAGVDPFDIEEWNVSICGTATQKGLESPPGLGIVAVSQSGWTAIEERNVGDHGWYSNLSLWREKANTKYSGEATIHPCLGTMAVNNVKALRASLASIIDEGMENRTRRHGEIASALRAGLEKMGFTIFPERMYRSSAVTVAYNALNIDIRDLIEFLKEKYRTEISNGIDELNNRIMRIGHIGPNASMHSILPVLFGIEHYLRNHGHSVTLGSSLAGIR
jgi:alanine-glyoxylate transaminase/serine-glyoxylate transaminase/serine-pyruvate transaminase